MSINKLLILVVVSASSTIAFAAAPSYVASFAGPTDVSRLVSSERLWSCEGATCLAGGAATSPAKHICARLAEDVGAVTAFSVKGRTFTADELAACNERAGRLLTPAAAK
jgi:hypothetical protein